MAYNFEYDEALGLITVSQTVGASRGGFSGVPGRYAATAPNIEVVLISRRSDNGTIAAIIFEAICDADGNQLGTTAAATATALQTILDGPEIAAPDRTLGTIGDATADFQAWPEGDSGDILIGLGAATISGILIQQGVRYRCTTDGTPADTPANWEELPIPISTAPAPIVAANVAMPTIAPNQYIKMAPNSEFMQGARITDAMNTNDQLTAFLQKLASSDWSSGISGVTIVPGTGQTSTYTIASTQTGTLVALGLRAAPIAGENSFRGLKVRIADATGTALAYSPSEDAFNDANEAGLIFDISAATDIYVPLDRDITGLTTGTDYQITVIWERGSLIHDGATPPVFRTIGWINSGDAAEVTTTEDIPPHFLGYISETEPAAHSSFPAGKIYDALGTRTTPGTVNGRVLEANSIYRAMLDTAANQPDNWEKVELQAIANMGNAIAPTQTATANNSPVIDFTLAATTKSARVRLNNVKFAVQSNLLVQLRRRGQTNFDVANNYSGVLKNQTTAGDSGALTNLGTFRRGSARLSQIARADRPIYGDIYLQGSDNSGQTALAFDGLWRNPDANTRGGEAYWMYVIDSEIEEIRIYADGGVIASGDFALFEEV